MSLFSVNEYGVISVDTNSIKETFEESYKQALGSELNLDSSTFQGQLIIGDTKFLQYAQEEALKLANSFTVRTAVGKALDIVAQNWGYYRKQAQATVVVATVRGTNGLVIPMGSKAGNGSYEFVTLEDVIISNGTGTVQLACTETGAIPCVAGTLTHIINPIQGWDSITNNVDGVIGWDIESDNNFRQRITANWLNIRGKSILGSIVDTISQLQGVVSCIGRENQTDNSVVVDGITMTPHSMYLSVLGGNGTDIARVILDKKTIGCDTVGNTNISVYDSSAGVNYTYKINTPTQKPIKVQITYSDNYYTPADVENNAKELMIGYVRDNPFKISQTISGAELTQIFKGFNQFDLLSVRVALVDGTLGDYVNVKINEVASLDVDNITFVKV